METLENYFHQSQSLLEEAFDLYLEKFEFQLTRKDFSDITLMLFPLLKQTRQNPSVLGESIGSYLVKNPLLFQILMWLVVF